MIRCKQDPYFNYRVTRFLSEKVGGAGGVLSQRALLLLNRLCVPGILPACFVCICRLAQAFCTP